MAEDLERNNAATDAGVDYSSELGKITTDIKSLADVPEDNDTQAKENLKTSLNENFLSGIAEFLNKPENELQKTELVNSVKDVLSKHKDDENFQTEYKSLIDLANALNIDYASVEQVAEDDAESGPQRPDDFSFNWKIDDVSPATDDQKNNRRFFNGIYKTPDNAPEGEKSQLESFEDKISVEYLVAIDWLLSSWLDDNQKANLEQIKKDLNNVLNIMWNPDKANTQKLQDFIFANLDENDKEQFKKDNHFREWRGFDWDFGIKTLEWLQKVLSKIEDHINSLKDYLKAIDDNTKKEILDNLKNWEKTFKKWGTPEEFIASLNLPEWVSATFASDEEKDKLNSEWAQDIKLNVTINGETQEIDVKVNITETTDAPAEWAWEWSGENTPEEPTNTEPITVWEGQHLVMSNSNQLASKYNLDWATFYSASAFNWVKAEWGQAEWGQAEWEQAQPQLAENTEMEDWEYVYYVKFNGMPNTYKIRVNEQWGLFPITTEYNSFADWLETRALIKNNERCVNYLKDKLWIPWISIQRNGSINDYTIRSFWEEITVEPMTMDKQWVSKDLWVCLRMLNLTNYLTSWVNEELRCTDPKLRLRGDRLQVQTIQWLKYISEETMRNFWLAWVDDWDMRRFIRYNNHEQWDDNWDAKNANKRYKKLDISSSAQILWWGEAAPQTAWRRFSAGSSWVWAGSVDVASAQTDDTTGSTEVTWEVLEQWALLWLLNWIKFNDLWTMRSSWYWYQMFEFNNVKTEWAKEWDDSWNAESGNESSDKSGNKYIEIWWHKFMEATDNFTGLWYKVTEHWVYIWEFKDGQKNWIWIDAPSTNDLNRPTYIWNFEKWLYNWNWKLELDGNSYEWEFKNWLWEWAWEFTWANWNKFKWTFYNPLWEWYLKFQTTNNNGFFERVVINPSNGQAMYVDNFFIGEMKSWTLTLDGKDYEVVDGKYTTDSWETKEIPHP